MKIAILDLGTNTFHLLIAEISEKGDWKKLFKSKMVVKLGEGAIDRNEIAIIPFKRGIKAMKHYQNIINTYKPNEVIAFATSAIRSACNGEEFVATVMKETGINIQVIDGDREAHLIYLGVKQCIDLANSCSLIIDIGGGSTEFIICNEKEIFWKFSYNIGVARLLAIFKPSDPITNSELETIRSFLNNELKPMFEAVEKFKPINLIGSSGSFDTFAEMIGYQFHGRNIMKGITSYKFDIDEYFQLYSHILFSTTAQRIKFKGLVKMRVDVIVLAAICTTLVIEKTGLKSMALSKYALKEGVLAQEISKVKKNN